MKLPKKEELEIKLRVHEEHCKNIAEKTFEEYIDNIDNGVYESPSEMLIRNLLK